MREKILEQYFLSVITTDILNDDIEGSEKKTGYDTSIVDVDRLSEPDQFCISHSHLLKLCNDAINGILKKDHLTTIAFALESSDYFYWDTDTTEGNIVGSVIFDWSSPQINFPITIENLNNWRTYLETANII